MTLYAVVIVTSGSAIIKLTAYRPVRVTATGNTALAMLPLYLNLRLCIGHYPKFLIVYYYILIEVLS